MKSFTWRDIRKLHQRKFAIKRNRKNLKLDLERYEKKIFIEGKLINFSTKQTLNACKQINFLSPHSHTLSFVTSLRFKESTCLRGFPFLIVQISVKSQALLPNVFQILLFVIRFRYSTSPMGFTSLKFELLPNAFQVQSHIKEVENLQWKR